MRARIRHAVLIVVALSGIAASCGETNIRAIERLRPRGGDMRSRLARVASALPETGSVSRLVAAPVALSPPLVLDFQRREYSADILMAPQLTEPDREVSFDLMLSPHLLHCLEWTGPKNPLDPSVWGDRGDLGPECERAFAIPWLVVVRTVRYELPERIDLEVFVVSLESERVVAAFPLQIRGRYTQADVGRGRFAQSALSDLRSDAFVATRCALGARLAKLPGVRVELRESWLGSVSDPCAGVGRSSFHAVDLDPDRALLPNTKPNRATMTPEPEGMPCSDPSDAGAPSSLEAVDWCNLEYRPNVIGLRQGRGEMHDYVDPGIHDTDLYRLRSVDYADLVGDTAPEALVVIDEQHYVGAPQSPWSGTQLFVFEWRGGAPRTVADAVLARAERVRVEGREVVVTTRSSRGEVCEQSYQVAGSKLATAGAARCTAAPPAR